MIALRTAAAAAAAAEVLGRGVTAAAEQATPPVANMRA